jgi:predicted nuclease of predicted toxin-antitoxin system
MHAIHLSDIGMSRAKDREVLRYAEKENCVIVTFDSDFHALLALSNARKPSVIRIRREGLGGPEVAKLLDQIWSKCRDAIQQGAMVTITENKIRIRYLPLNRGAQTI